MKRTTRAMILLLGATAMSSGCASEERDEETARSEDAIASDDAYSKLQAATGDVDRHERRLARELSDLGPALTAEDVARYTREHRAREASVKARAALRPAADALASALAISLRDLDAIAAATPPRPGAIPTPTPGSNA